jgi:hypothetical protein
VRLTEIDPLRLEYPILFQLFVDLLETKQVGDSNRFEIQPGKYSTYMQLLEQKDEKVWAYVTDKLRSVHIHISCVKYTLLTFFFFFYKKIRHSSRPSFSCNNDYHLPRNICGYCRQISVAED